MTTLVVKLSPALARRVAWAADELGAASHEAVALAALEQFTRALAATAATDDRPRSKDRRRTPRPGKDRRDA